MQSGECYLLLSCSTESWSRTLSQHLQLSMSDPYLHIEDCCRAGPIRAALSCNLSMLQAVKEASQLPQARLGCIDICSLSCVNGVSGGRLCRTHLALASITSPISVDFAKSAT